MSEGEAHPATSYRNVGFFFLAISIVAWAAPVSGSFVLLFRVVPPLMALGFLGAWLFKRTSGVDKAPDVLAEQFNDYFERDGLCFAATLEAVNGVCWWNLYCQNGYNRPCRGSVWFLPMEGMSTTPGEPSEVPPLIPEVQLNGGEVAVLRIPYPVAAKWQGRIMIYDVAATVEYPSGRGERLRAREGKDVPPPSARQAEMVKLAGLAMLGLLGMVAIGLTEKPKPSFEARLPQGVAEQPQSGVEAQTEILWPLHATSEKQPAA